MVVRFSQDLFHYHGRQIHATVLPDPHNRVAKYAFFHLNLDIIDLQTEIFLSINYIFDNEELNGNIWNSFRCPGLPDSSNRVAKYAFFHINFGLIDLGTWILCLYQHFRGWGIEWKYFENCSVLRVARSIQQGCQICVFLKELRDVSQMVWHFLYLIPGQP